MPLETKNLKLKKPLQEEFYDVDVANKNLDKIDEAIGGKVTKIDGKGLSSNDYTTEEKEKLARLENYDDSEIKKKIDTHRTYALTHTKSGTKHTFSDLPTGQGIYQCQFIATADYTENDTFTGYTAKPTGEEQNLPDKAFVIGDLVSITVDTVNKKLSFGNGGISQDKLDGKQDKPTGANTEFGYSSLNDNSTGTYNSAFGSFALRKNTTGSSNSASGYSSLYNNKIGSYNSAFNQSLVSNTIGSYNSGFGHSSLYHNTTGEYNSAFGYSSLDNNNIGEYNSAFGYQALTFMQDNSRAKNLIGCSGLGHNTKVSGNNQVQLGYSNTTVYMYGSPQNRSDQRDKSEIQNTDLGLDFVKRLRPVKFKWDYREDYGVEVDVIENIAPITLDDGTVVKNDIKTKSLNLPSDGKKKRKRFHQGFIAQEVKRLMDKQNVDFGGYQDHKINGGCDVLSLGYEEFIAPIVKAIQEQQNIIENMQKQIEKLINNQ